MLFSAIAGAPPPNPEVYPEQWLTYAKAVYNAVDDLPIIGHPVGQFNPFYGMGLPLAQTIQTCEEIPTMMAGKWYIR